MQRRIHRSSTADTTRTSDNTTRTNDNDNESRDGLRKQWTRSHQDNSIAFTVSGDGNVLLIRSISNREATLQLCSTTTGESYGQKWNIHDGRSSSSIEVLGIALDHTGHTAVAAYSWSEGTSRGSRAPYTTIKAWLRSKYLTNGTILYLRTLKEVESVDVLTLSPNGDFWAVAYTLRSRQQHIEIIRIRGELSSSRFFTITGWVGQQSLRPGRSIYFSDFDGFIQIAARRPEEVFVVEFESAWSSSAQMISIDGESFVSVDIHNGRQFRNPANSVTTPMRVECLRYSPNSKELLLATSQDLTTWNTVNNRRVHRRLVRLRLIEKPGPFNLVYSNHGDQLAISSGGLLWIMETSYFHSFRNLELSCLNVPHCLSFNDDSLLIIALENGQLECYKLPYHLSDEFNASGEPLDLSKKIVLSSEQVGSGGYGDVFKASWKYLSIDEAPEVAVKVMRFTNDREKTNLTKKHTREIEVWRRIKHANVVPFLGIMMNGTTPSLVSQWMANGTVNNFLTRYPDQNKLDIINGIVTGLDFLHTREPVIIHGDMKAENVLVDAFGRPRIADFGISRLLDDSTLWNTTKSSADGSLRWMSPELITGKVPRPTKKSDIYSFAMTAIEIVTGEVPFAKLYPRNEQVMYNVITYNIRPEQPSCEECNPHFWNLLTSCWDADPDSRWDMSRVKSELDEIVGRYRPVRILCIDHSYSRMNALFAYLRNIELGLENSDFKLGDYFDLICGSSFGGFIALLLGVLGLSVDECHAEYWALCLAFREIAKKHNMPQRLFEWENIYDDSTEAYLEDLIIRYGLDPNMCLNEFQFSRPFVLLIANTWRLTPSAHRSYRRPNDRASDTITLLAAFMHALALPGGHVCINPAKQALEEAHTIFSGHRKVGCLISCGMGHSFPPTFGSDNSNNDARVWSRMKYIRATKSSIEEINLKLREGIGDAYIRFDIKDDIESDTENVSKWRSIIEAQDWRILQALGDLGRRYMSSPEQKEKVRRCIERLGTPRRTQRKTVASSVEVDTMTSYVSVGQKFAS